jgi:hypothetical protein
MVLSLDSDSIFASCLPVDAAFREQARGRSPRCAGPLVCDGDTASLQRACAVPHHPWEQCSKVTATTFSQSKNRSIVRAD